MGGVGIASSEELAALATNPAAIALVKRGELSASVLYQRRDVESGYFSAHVSAPLSSGELSSVGLIYPVQVYRGALAFGVGFTRSALFDRDLVRRGSQPGAGGEENEILEERGSLDTWTFGTAVQISPSTFLGANLSLITGDIFRHSVFDYQATGVNYSFVGDEDLDLAGFRGSLGALFFPSTTVRVGFRIDLPYTVSFDGNSPLSASFDDGLEAYSDTVTYTIEDKVKYPPTAGFGVAARLSRVLVAADAEFAPYSLLEFNNERLRTQARTEGYRDIVRVGVGAEITLAIPLRLRAGYRFSPDPFRLMVAEVHNNEPRVGVMEVASVETERHVLSAGLGWLVDMALNVDVAVEYGISERSLTFVTQRDEWTRFTMTTSYRF